MKCRDCEKWGWGDDEGTPVWGWCWKYTSCPDPDIDRSCPDFSPKKPDIFTTLSTLKAENEKLRAELENYRKGHREEAISALSPPNEPLTQADLDSMDYDKVWLDYGADGEWALAVSGRIYSLAVLEGAGFEDILRDEVDGETIDRPSGDYAVYRRPPEGEDET